MSTSPAKSKTLIEATERVAARNYAPLPVVLARGEGSFVWDVDGRRYLDCISAFSSLNQGHRHPDIIRALVAQSEKLTLSSRAVHNDQLGPFLTRLAALSGYTAALPMNTGAEAVETALKLARKWAYRRKRVPGNEARIIVCRNNFHGRTTTIVGFSTEEQYRNEFGPFDNGFDIIDFGDSAALDRAIRPDTAAILLEPIQAEAGVNVPPDGFLTSVRKICRERNILMMLDEIQTGLGRTGRLFAYQHDDDARPDVLIIGKALGGGVYPVSAVLADRELMDVFEPGDHGSTFGGNPLAAAVGTAALDVIVNERLVDRAQALGHRLIGGLQAIASRHLRSIRGRGLLVGLELRKDFGTARELSLRLLEHGILAKDTHRQVLRLAPPLVVDEETIDWLIEEMNRVLS